MANCYDVMGRVSEFDDTFNEDFLGTLNDIQYKVKRTYLGVAEYVDTKAGFAH